MRNNDKPIDPILIDNRDVVEYDLTLRDVFAAAALAGMTANSTAPDAAPEEWAQCAYRLADAMLRERLKP